MFCCLLFSSYKYASEEIVDTALALAQAYAATGREEAESKCNRSCISNKTVSLISYS